MKTMEKRILVNLPGDLYENVKILAKKQYTSVSGLIRKTIADLIEEELSPKEKMIVESGRKSFHSGRGVNWRALKRDKI